MKNKNINFVMFFTGWVKIKSLEIPGVGEGVHGRWFPSHIVGGKLNADLMDTNWGKSRS